MSGLKPPDEAECWAEARNIVEQYGDDVGLYVHMMIDVCMERREYQLLLKWNAIRNCVALLVDRPGSITTQRISRRLALLSMRVDQLVKAAICMVARLNCVGTMARRDQSRAIASSAEAISARVTNLHFSPKRSCVVWAIGAKLWRS